MQSSPRKQRGSPDVKFSFSEQLCRAQSRQQLEVELLEELRSFSKQRAGIEKEYGQALQRLAAQYLRKDSSRGKADASDSRTTLGAWHSVVEATAQLGQARATTADTYRTVSVEAARTSRVAKDLRLKRCSEQLVRIQAELMEAVKELSKAKKRYFQRQRVAEITQEKAAEAQTKSKKSEFGIFQSKTSLQKLNVKLSSRLWESNRHVTEARNEYLLMISAVTAHQDQYIHTDLPQVLKNLDNDIYKRLQEFLTLIGKTEMDISQLGQECFQNVLESSRKISRETDLQIFLQDNPVFSETYAFTFQPVGTDKVCHLELDVDTKDGESSLDKEARKWATKLATHHKVVAHGDRVLQNLEQTRHVLLEEEAAVIELKMEEVKESIRKAEVGKRRAAARLALLRDAGVEVDAYVTSNMSRAGEELERERRLSEARASQSLSPEVSEVDVADFEEFEDSEETMDGGYYGTPKDTLPVHCTVLYSYQAGQSDELTITEGELLEVIEDGDTDDWVKARNLSAQVGYVPQRYLHFPSGRWSTWSCEATLPSGSLTEQELAGSSGLGQAEYRGCLARALYGYQGQSAEELCFPEGAVIRILHTGEWGVDDGFWQGEFGGRVGVFPSLLVEILKQGAAEPVADLEKGSPPFSPLAPGSVSVEAAQQEGQAMAVSRSLDGGGIRSEEPLNMITPSANPAPGRTGSGDLSQE